MVWCDAVLSTAPESAASSPSLLTSWPLCFEVHHCNSLALLTFNSYSGLFFSHPPHPAGTPFVSRSVLTGGHILLHRLVPRFTRDFVSILLAYLLLYLSLSSPTDCRSPSLQDQGAMVFFLRRRPGKSQVDSDPIVVI